METCGAGYRRGCALPWVAMETAAHVESSLPRFDPRSERHVAAAGKKRVQPGYRGRVGVKPVLLPVDIERCYAPFVVFLKPFQVSSLLPAELTKSKINICIKCCNGTRKRETRKKTQELTDSSRWSRLWVQFIDRSVSRKVHLWPFQPLMEAAEEERGGSAVALEPRFGKKRCVCRWECQWIVFVSPTDCRRCRGIHDEFYNNQAVSSYTDFWGAGGWTEAWFSLHS